MARDVELHLRRTGGLAGLAMVASLRTRDLDDEEARHVTEALDATDLTLVRASETPGAADTMHYLLEVREPGRVASVAFGERDIPESLAPVVRALMDRATPGH